MALSSHSFAVKNRRRVAIRAGITLAVAIALVGGIAETAQAALPSGPTVTGQTGARTGATRLTFGITDQVSATVDVGTGNLLVSTRELSLPGVNSAVAIGDSYNSLGQSTGTTSTPFANKWTYGLDGAGGLSSVSGGVVYTGGDGSTWLFTPVSGSTTAYNSPAGLKEVLVGSGTGYTLTDLTSRQVVTFNTNGLATSVADKNGNTTTIGYSSSTPTSVVGTAGATAARTAALSYNLSLLTYTVTQTNGSLTRNVKFVKDSSNNLASIVDANGKTTAFGYGTGGLTSITSPTGAVTNITYDTSGKVAQIDQLNTSTGSPGTSTTRLTYPSSTQTLIAGPDTSTGTPVASGDHSTYTIDTNKLVTGVTDEMGRVRAKTYTPNFDTATTTSGTGGTAGTTTATYGANSGQSVTKVQAPGGAASQAAYANTAPSSQYLPSSTTDTAGNQSLYTYNGTGNALTSSDASAATATLTYNTDGTVATALAPNNGTNTTVYGYNTSHQLTGITPPTGTSLGARAFTYDGFGRLFTATDGRGITLTYGYDKVDRLLTTTFSDSTPTVTSTYSDAGQVTNRVDGSGTTTYTFDQLGRLTATANTAGGGTISYTYDQASNLTSTTDSRGTTTNSFDASGVVTQMSYPKGGAHQVLAFATDNQGRRTDEWLQSNIAHTTWAAHTQTSYDTSNRVSHVVAQSGTGNASYTTVVDQTYCYNSASAAPTCATGATTDRSKVQWTSDAISGITSTYTYDTSGRLTGVTQTGTGANTYAYTYDSNGNRLTATVTGAAPSSQTLTANAANEVTSTGYTFDGTGNMTADPAGAYNYNGAEQLTSAIKHGNTITYTYAGTAQNEVLSETGPGGTYHLAYGRDDAQGQPIVEQFQANAGTAYVESDPVTGQPLMLHTSSDIAALYIYDGTGSPVGLLTDYATTAYIYSFDPYGVPVVTAGGTGSGIQQNPYLFKGGIQSRALGWVHYGARWYNPTTGRFTQQDTLDTPLNPANANRYAYAADDPINNSDPTGLDQIDDVLGSCATGALEGVGIGLGLGVTETGVGALADAGFGCAVGALGATLDDSGYEGASDGLDYLTLLDGISEFGEAAFG